MPWCDDCFRSVARQEKKRRASISRTAQTSATANARAAQGDTMPREVNGAVLNKVYSTRKRGADGASVREHMDRKLAPPFVSAPEGSAKLFNLAEKAAEAF